MGAKDRSALSKGISSIGFSQPVAVWKVEGGTYELVNGHHRLEEVVAQGGDQIDCVILDITEPEARKLAISLNSIGAQWNFAELDDYVRGMIDDSVTDINDFQALSGFTGAEVKILSSQGTDFLGASLGDGQVKPWLVSEDMPEGGWETGAENKAAASPLPYAERGRDAGFDASNRQILLGASMEEQDDGRDMRIERRSFTVWLTVDERAHLIAAINHCKSDQSLTDSSSAISKICEMYNDVAGVDPIYTPADGKDAEGYTDQRETKRSKKTRRLAERSEKAGGGTARAGSDKKEKPAKKSRKKKPDVEVGA